MLQNQKNLAIIIILVTKTVDVICMLCVYREKIV